MQAAAPVQYLVLVYVEQPALLLLQGSTTILGAPLRGPKACCKHVAPKLGLTPSTSESKASQRKLIA